MAELANLSEFTRCIVPQLVDKVMHWLDMIVNDDVLDLSRKILLDVLQTFRKWGSIVKQAVERGVQAGIDALTALKEQVMQFLIEHKKVVERLTKIGVTVGTRLVVQTTVKQVAKSTVKAGVKQGSGLAAKSVVKAGVKQGSGLAAKSVVKAGVKQGSGLAAKSVVKAGVKQGPGLAAKSVVKAGVKQGSGLAAKSVVKAGVKQGSGLAAKNVVKAGVKQGSGLAAKNVVKAGGKQGTVLVAKNVAKGAGFTAKMVNPVGIGADLTQAVLEYGGYEKAGKAVGMTGNMAAGAMFGAVGGPPGVVLGAIGGFALWGVGEVTGGLV